MSQSLMVASEPPESNLRRDLSQDPSDFYRLERLDKHSAIKAFERERIYTSLMSPYIRFLVVIGIRRAGTALAIVDSGALLAAIESKPRCWPEGSQQPRGLELCESVGTEAAGGPFKQELIHASAL